MSKEKLKTKDLGNYDDVLAYFVLNSLTHLNNEDFNTIRDRNGDRNGEMEIEFIINGIKVPVRKTIESIYERMNDNMNERARKMIKKELEKSSDIVMSFIDMLTEAKGQLEQKLIDEGCYDYARGM